MEIWKSIKGFERYEISSLGNVRTLFYKGTSSSKILKQRIKKTGYSHVGIYNSQGKQITKAVHRLVAIAFIDNPKNKPTVNHINENKKDNRLENLGWMTISENTLYSYNLHAEHRESLKNIGIKGSEKITLNILVHKDGLFVGEYKGKARCAKELGISEKTIYNRLKNKFSSRSGYTFTLKEGVVA